MRLLTTKVSLTMFQCSSCFSELHFEVPSAVGLPPVVVLFAGAEAELFLFLRPNGWGPNKLSRNSFTKENGVDYRVALDCFGSATIAICSLQQLAQMGLKSPFTPSSLLLLQFVAKQYTVTLEEQPCHSNWVQI